ncbi:MAG: BON domain-containing protein [Myxococcaceae bacterium]|nr:BON domain-containing protein [Myxococcaceae bacterium]
MADRRNDEERRFRGERRDPDTERRIDWRADRYRGSDERGYGGGERLGREWERGDPRAEEHFDRDMRVRSVDEEHFDRGGRGADYGDRGGRHGYETRRFGEGPEHGEHNHSHLAGLRDLDDMSELKERYRERRRRRDHPPHYGHGPGVENMEPPLSGYGTSTTRIEDHELGHGGFLGGGGTYRSGAPRPTGRGPKSYQRSDARIREDICDRLMTGWMDAENVEVLVREGEVTLEGTVRSREEKWAIEALAESVLGVKDIHNTLRVIRGEQASAEAPGRRAQAQERRAEDSEQTSAQRPEDTTLHS